jgi:hypothetical protein
MKFGKSGCMTFILLLFLLAALINFLKGPEQTQQPQGNPQTAQQQPAPAKNTGMEFPGGATKLQANTLKHSVMREWQPSKSPRNLGLEIVLENPEPTEQELIELVTKLATGREVVIVNVYATRAAYSQEVNKKYGDDWKKGYLLSYIKNGPGDDGEIRWMQEVGKFSDKFGTVTKLGNTN